MNEFNALRQRARDKRDKAIAEVRREYEAALVQIAALEQDLLGKVSSRYKKISAAIESVIPRESEFTTADIMAGLEALDPRRSWRKRSIDNHISRLRERGLIKRLKRATVHEPAVYARAEAPVKAAPLDDMTLLQVIGKVLAVRPMTTTEVVVAVLEAGYQTTMAKTALRNHVTRQLGRGGFKQEDGRWVA
jgi:hypothetical protein